MCSALLYNIQKQTEKKIALHCDHATKPFKKMFQDSEIPKKFSCACIASTKTTAIKLKRALAPHFTHDSVVISSSSFSLMMDDSNDKTVT